MQSILLIIHLIVAIIMIVAILMQRSEGGALGIGGGGGSGGGGFGGMLKGRSSGGSIVKFTVILGSIFFITSISLTVINTFSKKSILTEVEINNTVNMDAVEENISIDNLVKDLSPSVPISQ
ncbi:preprotein translocase subunit SecG [Hyphomicrobiales bacterium]|jgi:preprotein translocase subunit SecG|nr:preprotein translocase subunit SecG [Rhodobiaceae bacterium]MBT5640165.1 preprotein translocase subunit SecG [Rhodobiaceae bacterium]MBT6222979.1 preprotein translocase subunit SecG [Rhodobiaceae bacterium]MDB4127951.1 preprotein translocase subunit SecG [Hyphomicrobiales bacterium]MDC3271932.1 preprotein translocase subunit SecG [Hyphomicrobiales bacterium]|tara:strand:+ start:90 stop:455 length:366 start_codon:yes stop_codon:yes gene_type:complete